MKNVLDENELMRELWHGLRGTRAIDDWQVAVMRAAFDQIREAGREDVLALLSEELASDIRKELSP